MVPVYRAYKRDETGGELRDSVVRPNRKVELFDRQTVSILILHQSCMLRNLATKYVLRNSNLRMAYKTDPRGCEFTLEFRNFFRNSEDTIVSPFHDIPFLANQDPLVYNMVVEVPRWSNAKMEIATKELLSPIKQDVKKGNLRLVTLLNRHIRSNLIGQQVR